MKEKSAKSKDAKGGKGKKAAGVKKSLRTLKDESESDRAKAAAALWEARLEVTEISRKEYRESARLLARTNEQMERQQRRLEKDVVDVITYLKKQDLEKEEQIEKLKQHMHEVKCKAKEEIDEVVNGYFF